jgi:hypothetical protein
MMYDLKFQSCKADPDVWYHPETKKEGTQYYEDVFIYVDGILTVWERPKDMMETLTGIYCLKEDSTTGNKYDHPT